MSKTGEEGPGGGSEVEAPSDVASGPTNINVEVEPHLTSLGLLYDELWTVSCEYCDFTCVGPDRESVERWGNSHEMDKAHPTGTPKQLDVPDEIREVCR